MRCISSLLLAGSLALNPSAHSETISLDTSDVSLEIKIERMPLFPQSLIHEGYLEGFVHLALEIDYDGELRDWLAVEYSHPDFVESVEKAIGHWRFSAPYINGENRSVVTKMTIEYHSRGAVLSIDNNSTAYSLRINELLGYNREGARLARVSELDTDPYIIDRVNPLVPREVISEHRGSRVVYQFYVDEAGRVRIPALVRTDGAPEPGMILAAQEALKEWKFSPPTKRSKPVVVQLTQEFVFTDR